MWSDAGLFCSLILLFLVGTRVKQYKHTDLNSSHKVSTEVDKENLLRNAPLNLFIVSFLWRPYLLYAKEMIYSWYFVAAVVLEMI